MTDNNEQLKELYGTNDEPMNAPADLQAITKQAAELKDRLSDLQIATKQAQDKYNAITQEILRTLDLMELDSIRAHGFLFYKETKTSVTTPKTVEQKRELFKFLQDSGMFDEMVSVNSQTLNSLYKSLADQAAKNGVLDFKLPGVDEPTIYYNLKLRRG